MKLFRVVIGLAIAFLIAMSQVACSEGPEPTLMPSFEEICSAEGVFLGQGFALASEQEICLADSETQQMYNVRVLSISDSVQVEVNGQTVSAEVGKIFMIGGVKHTLRIDGDRVRVAPQENIAPWAGGWFYVGQPEMKISLYPEEMVYISSSIGALDGTNPQYWLQYGDEGWDPGPGCQIEDNIWVCEDTPMAEIYEKEGEFAWVVEMTGNVYPTYEITQDEEGFSQVVYHEETIVSSINCPENTVYEIETGFTIEGGQVVINDEAVMLGSHIIVAACEPSKTFAIGYLQEVRQDGIVVKFFHEPIMMP